MNFFIKNPVAFYTLIQTPKNAPHGGSAATHRNRCSPVEADSDEGYRDQARAENQCRVRRQKKGGIMAVRRGMRRLLQACQGAFLRLARGNLPESIRYRGSSFHFNAKIRVSDGIFLKHLFLLQHCDFQYQSIWSNLMNFSFIKAWLAQMDGAFTTRRVHVNAPFTPVRFSLGHSFQFWIRTLFQTWGLILH